MNKAWHLRQDGKAFPVLINADKLDEETNTFMLVAKDVSNFNKQKENYFTKKEMSA